MLLRRRTVVRGVKFGSERIIHSTFTAERKKVVVMGLGKINGASFATNSFRHIARSLDRTL